MQGLPLATLPSSYQRTLSREYGRPPQQVCGCHRMPGRVASPVTAGQHTGIYYLSPVSAVGPLGVRVSWMTSCYTLFIQKLFYKSEQKNLPNCEQTSIWRSFLVVCDQRPSLVFLALWGSALSFWPVFPLTSPHSHPNLSACLIGMEARALLCFGNIWETLANGFSFLSFFFNVNHLLHFFQVEVNVIKIAN